MSRKFAIQQLIWATAVVLMLTATLPLTAQDDRTTQNGASALGGGWITGPASNPLSHLNGQAFRTDAASERYDVHDFAPMTLLDAKLPHWIAFQAEERYRFENYDNASFKAGSNDAYELNRFRFQVDLRPNSWIRFTAQNQDARPFYQTPPLGPPNENRWDLNWRTRKWAIQKSTGSACA